MFETLRQYQLLSVTHFRLTQRTISAVKKQSSLMVFVIILFTMGYFLAGYGLFYGGLNYLVKNFPILGALLSERLLFLTFGFLFFMLVLSNIIIGYSSLFKNWETQWLMSKPVTHRDLYFWKSLETMMLASWAFLFLIIPLVTAYGSVMKWGVMFYLPMLAAFIPYALIASTLGMALLMVVAPLLQRRRGIALIVSVVLGASLLFWKNLKPVDPDLVLTLQAPKVLGSLLENTRFLLNPLWPSSWLANCLLSASDGLWGRAFFYYLVMGTTALFGWLLSYRFLAQYYYSVWNCVQSREAGRREPSGTGSASSPFIVWRFLRCFPGCFFPKAWVTLMIKDMQCFCRDPMQWSQFVIFFGLLGVYIFSLRNLHGDLDNAFWKNIIAHLNFGASSMTLATLTTRFVFPQFSLEGRRLWLVGLSPIGLRGVFLEKFFLSFVFTGSITFGLLVSTGWVLKLPLTIITAFGVNILLMSAALSAVSVGLGVLYPNFKDDNPAKIVSGFGGTFCLVVSIFYILFSLALLAVPTQLPLIEGLRHSRPASDFEKLIFWGRVFFVTLSTSLIALPLYLGWKRVETLEI